MAERTRSKAEKKAYKVASNKTLAREGKASVAVNKHAVVALVLDASRDRVEALHVETTRTIKRLGIRWRRAAAFKSAPKGVGGTPNIFDVKVWLDSLTRANKDGLGFLRSLHKTATIRLA